MNTPSASSTAFTSVEVDGTTYSIALPYAESDYIQRTIFDERKPYELEMLRAMRGCLSENDLVLDVGANIGNHTLYLAAVAGVEVVAYEPDRRLTDALSHSILENGLEDKVTVRQVAVAEAPGELVLVDDVAGNLGGQHVVADAEADGVRVEVVRLDDEIPERHVAAVKIDVEGYEENVLDGALALLERDRPDLWIECLNSDHYRAISERIRPLGYRVDGVFNASPTYRFVHDSDPSAEVFTATMDQIVERFYADHAAYLSTRESLLTANEKYRTVTKQYGELRDRMHAQMGSTPDVQSASLLAVRHAEERALALQTRLTELSTEKHELSESLQRRVAELSESMRALASELERHTSLHRKRINRVRARARRENAARQRERDVARAHARSLEEEVLQARREIKILTATGDGLAAQLDGLRTNADELEESRASTAEQCAKLDGLLVEREAHLQRLQTEHDEVTSRMHQYETQLGDLRTRQSRYREDFNVLREYVDETDLSLESYGATIDTQAAKISELEAELNQTATALREVRSEKTMQRQQLADEESRSRTLALARDKQIERVEGISIDLEALFQEHSKLQHEFTIQGQYSRRLRRARDTEQKRAESREVELAERERAYSELKALLTQTTLEFEEKLEYATEQLDASASRLTEVRASRKYRAGQALHDARTWSGFWALVPRLISIAQERKD